MGSRTRTTWTKDNRPTSPGRPRGTRDKVPRSLKASIIRVCQSIVEDNPRLIRRALVAGLRAKPPHSFAYLQLFAAYLDGKPKDRVGVDGRLEVGPSPAAMLFIERLERQRRAMAAIKPPTLGMPPNGPGSWGARSSATSHPQAASDGNAPE